MIVLNDWLEITRYTKVIKRYIKPQRRKFSLKEKIGFLLSNDIWYLKIRKTFSAKNTLNFLRRPP